VISEEILLQRMRTGDGAAFEEFIRRYESRIYNYHCWFTGDLSLAEDLTQETFTAIWQGLKGFKGNSRFATWIHRITRNIALQQQRSKPPPALPLDCAEDPAGEDATAKAVERSLLRDQVRAALGELPAPQREAVILHKLNGLSHAEVAQVLAKPLGTIKWQIAQALQSLRSSLQREGVTDGKV
jgi:RNA polymerase sigma factor (sigma-70 family)